MMTSIYSYMYYHIRKVYTVMVIVSTNINKTNNHLSSQLNSLNTKKLNLLMGFSTFTKRLLQPNRRRPEVRVLLGMFECAYHNWATSKVTFDRLADIIYTCHRHRKPLSSIPEVLVLPRG
jgi:hypothetical protein